MSSCLNCIVKSVLNNLLIKASHRASRQETYNFYEQKIKKKIKRKKGKKKGKKIFKSRKPYYKFEMAMVYKMNTNEAGILWVHTQV